MKRIFISLSLSLLCASASIAQSKTFNAVSLNIDGLPQTLKVTSFLPSITLNDDKAPFEKGSEAMGKFIKENRPEWDIFALSEDFNFEDNFRAGVGDGYSFGTHRGKLTGGLGSLFSLPYKTDGLNLMVRDASGIKFSNERWEEFTQRNGTTSNGSDEWIQKGFRYYLIDFGDGLQCDLYIHHMDAETDPADNAARASNVSQVVQAIINSNTTRPIIIMGDSNCRYTRDDLQTLLFDKINATGYLQVRDPWVDFNWYGIKPALGTTALMVNAYGAQRGEVVDKIWYINNKKGGLKLTANSFLNDDNFKAPEGVNFADHTPVVVNFTIEKTSNLDDVFVPDPEAPANPFTAEKYYLRNAGGEDLYLSGGGYWDVQAMLDQTGYGYLVKYGSTPNTFVFHGMNVNGFIGSNLYMDGPVTDWYVTPVSDETSELYVLSIMDGGVMKALTKVENKDNTPYYHPDYTVALQEYRQGDHDQQWELITESERDRRLAESVHSDPNHWRDVTYKIPSFNFPNGCIDFNNWNETIGNQVDKHEIILEWGGGSDPNINYETGYGGIYYYHNKKFTSSSRNSSEFSLETKITNIPNGTYRFKCQVYANNLNYSTTNLNIKVGNKLAIPTSATSDIQDFKTAGKEFRDGKWWITISDVTVNGEELTIRFEKTNTTSETAFFIDNLRLEYIAPDVVRTPDEVELSFPNHYNTMILPFALDEAKVSELNNDGIYFKRVTGFSDGRQDTETEGEILYHKIELSDPHSIVEANIPYIVINENVDELFGREMNGNGEENASQHRIAKADATNNYTYTFTGQPLNKNYFYTDPIDSQNTLTGVLVNTYVFPGHYSLDSSDYMQAFMINSTDNVRSIDANRCYINAINADGNEYDMFVFDDSTNLLTGVEKVASDEATAADAPVEFYNLQGIRVENPTRGIYIRRQGSKVNKIAL